MPKKSRWNPAISHFIIQEVDTHPRDITALTAAKFKISRVTVGRYLRKLIAEGMMTASGTTKARQYQLCDLVLEVFHLSSLKDNREDVVWREKILPLLHDIRANVVDICHWGVTEMINNVIDHSNSPDYIIEVSINAKSIAILIKDFGIGIFEKIRTDFHLEDPRYALLELAKGKLTSDPENHSGIGIFFTSHMFNVFAIASRGLLYSYKLKNEEDWLEETKEHLNVKGTYVYLEIDRDETYTAKEIFDKYAMPDEFEFKRTHVPVRLARYGDELLVSRSQAKRVLIRFEKFSEIMLDFDGVQQIGQAFADEIFRVYKNRHPEIKITTINTNSNIDAMIKYVTA